jgi:hypothetical protein
MLRVRLPPEPLTKHMSSWSSQECSPRCQRGDRGFKSRRGRFLKSARYANWKSGEAQTFVILRVRLPPLPLEACVGWALACPSGCNPPASGSAGSGTEPAEEAGLVAARRTEARKSARSSIGSGQQPLTLQRRVQFPHGSFGTTDQVVQLVDTRRSERRACSGLGVRLSPWSFDIRCRRGWRPTGSHKAGRPVRFRGLQLTQTLTQVGQRPVKAHTLRLPGATPGPATSWPSTQTGKAADHRHSRRCPEPGDFVGSTPNSATARSRGQTARHQPDMLETMVQLHPGSFSVTVCRCFGSTPLW